MADRMRTDFDARLLKVTKRPPVQHGPGALAQRREPASGRPDEAGDDEEGRGKAARRENRHGAFGEIHKAVIEGDDTTPLRQGKTATPSHREFLHRHRTVTLRRQGPKLAVEFTRVTSQRR